MGDWTPQVITGLMLAALVWSGRLQWLLATERAKREAVEKLLSEHAARIRELEHANTSEAAHDAINKLSGEFKAWAQRIENDIGRLTLAVLRLANGEKISAADVMGQRHG